MQTWKKRDTRVKVPKVKEYREPPYLINPSPKLKEWLDKNYPLIEVKERPVNRRDARELKEIRDSWNEKQPPPPPEELELL